MASTLYSLSWSFILQIFFWKSPPKVTSHGAVQMMHAAPSVHRLTSPFPTALRSPLSALFHFPIALSSSNIQSLSRFITSHFQYLLLIICYILHPRLNAELQQSKIYPTPNRCFQNTKHSAWLVQGTKGTQFILVKWISECLCHPHELESTYQLRKAVQWFSYKSTSGVAGRYRNRKPNRPRFYFAFWEEDHLETGPFHYSGHSISQNKY